SILASLVVALTVTPALCRLLLSRVGSGGAHGEGPVARWVKGLYAPSLELALRFRGVLFASVLLMLVGSILLGRTFGTSFLPTFNEGTFTVFLMGPPGTSLEASDRLSP